MTTHPAIQCTWNGLGPDGEQVRSCGKPAIGYIDGPHGRVYTCEEHVGHAKQQAGSGRLVHDGLGDPTSSPPVTSHAATRQARHNASVVGETR
jgi:hypothetical protein